MRVFCQIFTHLLVVATEEGVSLLTIQLALLRHLKMEKITIVINHCSSKFKKKAGEKLSDFPIIKTWKTKTVVASDIKRELHADS